MTTEIHRLNKKQYRGFLTIQELYRQQDIIFENEHYYIEDRIVSISGPHVRTIVRGKTNEQVEFEANSVHKPCERVCFFRSTIVRILKKNVLKNRLKSIGIPYGVYPETTLEVIIYSTRKNWKHCKELGVRLICLKFGGTLLG